MRKNLYAAVIIIVSVFLSCTFALADDWYDFGNGKINLRNVSFMIPKISLSYHPVLKQEVKQKLIEGGFLIKGTGGRYENSAQLEKEGGIIGMFKSLNGNQEQLKTFATAACLKIGFGNWTNPLSEKDIEIVIDSINPENLGCYEDVRVSAYIMFDDFKLELYTFSKEKITKGDVKEIEKGLEKALKAYKKID